MLILFSVCAQSVIGESKNIIFKSSQQLIMEKNMMSTAFPLERKKYYLLQLFTF